MMLKAGASDAAQASQCSAESTGKIFSWMKTTLAPASTNLVAIWVMVAAASSSVASEKSSRGGTSSGRKSRRCAARVNGPLTPAHSRGSSRRSNLRRWITSTATVTRGLFAASSGERRFSGNSPGSATCGHRRVGGWSSAEYCSVAPSASASRKGSKWHATPSERRCVRIWRKELVIFVALQRKARSGRFSTFAPSENTMGRKSGRGGGAPCSSPLRIWRGVRMPFIARSSRAEAGAGGFGVRPGAVPLRDFFRRTELAPVLLELVVRFAAGQASAAFFVAKLPSFFGIEFAADGIVSDAVNTLRGGVRDDFFLHVFENFRRIAFERIAVSGPAAAETEKQIAFVIDLGSARDQFHIPISLDAVILEDGAEIHGE